jgi:hypothetical protein
LNLNSDSLSKARTQRSSSEALINLSAPDTDQNGVRINGAKIFPDLISDLLTDGHMLKFRAPGDSMYPTICDGDVITVMPIESASINIGDIILYRHSSGVTAHRVTCIAKRDTYQSQHAAPTPQSSGLSPHHLFYFRGDAAIVFDNPVCAEQVLGKVTLVEREGRRINPYTRKAIICYKARRLASCIKRLFLRPDLIIK